MENSGSRTDASHSLWDVSAALFELRDALVEMSLFLRDWQFNADLEQRRLADEAAHQLLTKVAAARKPSS